MNTKLALITLALLATAGCSRQPTLEEAKATFCTDLATLRQNVASLAAVSQNSTVGQLKEAQAAVADSFQAVKASAAQIQDLRVDKLDKAHQDLDKAIKDVSDSDTIADAIASVQPAVANVQTAQDELSSTAACQ